MNLICTRLLRAAVCVVLLAHLTRWGVAEETPDRSGGFPSLFRSSASVAGEGKVLQVDGEATAAARVAKERLRVHIARKGGSSKDELAAAVERLPLDRFSPEDRRKVNEVVDSVSLFRRLPTITCEADPRAYRFFAEHPDVAVSMWRVMGVSQMQMWQVSEREFESDLKDGTVGLITVLHQSPRLHVAMCEGEFKSPVLARPIRSTGLLAVQTEFWQDESGRRHITHSADMFVTIHSEAVEAVARLISPVSFKMADRNFEEVTLFLRMVDEAMTNHPGWVEQVADRVDGVLPGRDAELLKVTAEVYADAKRRTLRRRGEPAVLDVVRPRVRSNLGSSDLSR